MFEGLEYIELSGEKYPIKCDLLVLERIQEEFGSINEFEDGLLTWEPERDEKGFEILGEDGEPKYKGKFPSMKAVNAALYYMAVEGEAIIAEKERRKPRPITKEALVRKVDMRPTRLANILHGEFYRCFRLKNQETTQNPASGETTNS